VVLAGGRWAGESIHLILDDEEEAQEIVTGLEELVASLEDSALQFRICTLGDYMRGSQYRYAQKELAWISQSAKQSSSAS